MSLHNLAQQLAAQGRGGDTILAHINPQEAALLKSLGGSGTINPKTGLPEYFGIGNITGKKGFLRKTVGDDILGINTSQGTGLAGSIINNPILAPIAGAALSMIPGVGPLLAAGLVGGFTGIQSGSLKNGLMAGLGAYGGASLAGSFGAGAGAGAGAGTGSTPFGDFFSSGTTAPIVEGVPYSTAPSAAGLGSDVMYGSGAGSAAGSASSPSFFDKFTKAPLSTLGGGNPYIGAAVAGLPVLAAISKNQKTPMPTLDSVTPDSYIRPYRLTRKPNTEPYSGTGERRYFDDTWEALTPYKAGKTPTGATGGVVAFNQGGLGTLGGYSDGGRLLRGPGDGVSDNIPATIGDRQPARLADGEFVVPARIVSEIGNGSTEAGARKLYAMMDRVQRARRKTVGHDRVATDTNAERLLPA